jgi:hypothetical protein
MRATHWFCLSCVFVLLLLAGCGMNSSTEITSQAETPPSQPDMTDPPEGEPVLSADGVPCLNTGLGIELTMPDAGWNCEPLNDRWLKLTSPLFEVNISNLGRGPFCFPDMDSSCETTPFLSNQILDLQLYTSGGQPREIFALTDAEVMEIEKLVSTLNLLDP